MKNEKQVLWRRAFLLTLLVFGLGAFLWFMIPKWIHSGFAPTLRIPDRVKFKIYQGNSPYNFIFEYPELWQLRESGYKDQYDSVEILGRKDPVNKSVPGFLVFKKPAQKTEKGVNAEWMDARLKQESRLSNFKLLENQETTFQGYPAKRIRYQYQTMLPFRAKEAKEILFQKEMIWVQKDLFWYEIIFSSTQEQSNTLAPVWKHFLKTFRFLESSK